MGSRQQTGVEGARLPPLSRRAVLVGTSAAAASTPTIGVASRPRTTVAPVDGAQAYRRFLYIDGKISRLQRWARLESYLVDHHNWCRLTDAEQRTLPAAQELRDIDGMLELLFEQREALLPKLPARGASSLQVVVARLAVVERLIWRDDFPEAHAMIAGAREDLLRFIDAANEPH